MDFDNLKKELRKSEISKTAQEFLLTLSRQALEYYFNNNTFLPIDKVEIPLNIKSELIQKRATFVTLEKKQFSRFSLRGCIGHLIAINPLYVDILENTYAAAFNDPRFPPLQKEELKDIRIELSILTPQFKYDYNNVDELLNVLNKYKPGVVLELYGRQATFLPQVWEDLPDSKKFLENLCLKAGFTKDCIYEHPQIYIYFAQKFKEDLQE